MCAKHLEWEEQRDHTQDAAPTHHQPSAVSKIKSGHLTPAFSGAQTSAEMLRHPCILADPQPKRGEQNQKWSTTKKNKIKSAYITRAFSAGPKEGGNATPPLHSRRSPTPSAGSKVRSGCLIPAFCGAQKRAEMLRHPCILTDPQRHARGQNQNWSPTKGNKIRSGYLTPAFSGAQKRAEMLRHPCILTDPQRQARGAKSEVVPNKGEQNQKCLPHPCPEICEKRPFQKCIREQWSV